MHSKLVPSRAIAHSGSGALLPPEEPDALRFSVLLPGVGSLPLELATAKFIEARATPAACRVIVIGAEVRAATAPTTQLTVLPLCEHPALLSPATKVTPLGTMLVMTVPPAASGPALATDKLNAALLDERAVAVPVSDRSAPAVLRIALRIGPYKCAAMTE